MSDSIPRWKGLLWADKLKLWHLYHLENTTTIDFLRQLVGDQEHKPGWETIKKAIDEFNELTPAKVKALPQTLGERWQELNGSRTPATTTTSGAVSIEHFRDIENVAAVVNSRLRVPDPKTPLLDLREEKSQETDDYLTKELVENYNTVPLITFSSTFLNTPWWRSDGPPIATLN